MLASPQPPTLWLWVIGSASKFLLLSPSQEKVSSQISQTASYSPNVVSVGSTFVVVVPSLASWAPFGIVNSCLSPQYLQYSTPVPSSTHVAGFKTVLVL